jgi:uncharacterized protein YcbK (DUF882 family)
VPDPTASKPSPLLRLSRIGCHCGLAVLFILLGNDHLQNAVANGDTRTLSLHHTHTKEDITVTFKRNGRYDEDGLTKLNWFLRDWRRDEQTRMDPHLFDVVWEVHREVGAKQPVHIISAFRSPATNSMLRRRGRGVAQFSQHMVGKAIDFFIPDVPLEELRVAGLRLQRGGVGFYPSSGSPFVHLDVGSVRHWPRMTRDQLVRAFPDGRTVHIPSDGQALSGYSLALADIERRGGNASSVSLAAAQNAGVAVASAEPRAGSNLLAKLFGFGEEDDDEAASQPTPPAAGKAQVSDKPTAAAASVASLVPLPRARPAARNTESQLQLASAASSPSQIVAARGYWGGVAGADRLETGARKAAAEPQTTGSIDPFAGLSTAATPADRVPTELVLAYAAQAGADALPRLPPMGSLRTVAPAKAVMPRAARPPSTIRSAMDPWLRGLVLTPSVQHAMRVGVLGPADYRGLRRFMHKPAVLVAMDFSEEPYADLKCDVFSGPAIAFVPTVPLAIKTAGLN